MKFTTRHAAIEIDGELIKVKGAPAGRLWYLGTARSCVR